MIYHLGLLGFPLSHSISPSIHLAALRSTGLVGDYKLYPLQKGSSFEYLLTRMRKGEIHGLNVTIPHKQSMLSHVDLLSHTVRMTGAVNTLLMREGQLVGDNTDVAGFMTDLHEKIGGTVSRRKALVLGAGGAARAVVIGLLSTGWHVVVSARQSFQARQLVEQLKPWSREGYLQSVYLDPIDLNAEIDQCDLLVNATSAGMASQLLIDPLPLAIDLPNDLVLYDLIYNPQETLLMQRFRKEGKLAYNGLGMLIEQAARSFELWTGLPVSREELWKAVGNLR
ncbi:MAG: shikimate dehydrogenase [Chloroflexi bacterium 44-23]|nr:MAG: shikimate dehydrogenase [Chloroflexi bacterium 44-23]